MEQVEYVKVGRIGRVLLLSALSFFHLRQCRHFRSQALLWFNRYLKSLFTNAAASSLAGCEAVTFDWRWIAG
jgi:hypothetical protein